MINRTPIFLSFISQAMKVISIFLVAVTLLCSCGTDKTDEITPTPQPTPQPAPDVTVSVKLSTESLTFPSEGGTEEVLVTVSPQGTSLTVESKEKWISIDRQNGKDIITVSVNVTEEAREATISYIYNNKTLATLVVKQEGQRKQEKLEAVLKENTVGIAEKISDEITAVDVANQTLHWSSKVKAEDLPKVGEKCIMGIVPGVLPYGLLARIEKITEVSDGFDVSYTPVELTDCFEKLDIQNLKIDMSNVEFIEADGEYIDLTRTRAQNEAILQGKLPISITKDFKFKNDKIVVSPNISGSIEASVDFQLDGLSVKYAALDYTISTDVGLGFNVVLAEYAPNFGHVELGNYRVGTMFFMAGEVPVVIVFHVCLDFVHKMTAKVSLDASLTYGIDKRVKKEFFEDGREVTSQTTYQDGIKSFSVGPKLEGSYQCGLGVGPVASIYGVAGIGVAQTFQIKNTVAAKLEMVVPKYVNPLDLTWILRNTSLSQDLITTIDANFWSLAGKFSFEEAKNTVRSWFGKGLDDSQEFVFPIRSWNVLPNVSSDYRAKRVKEVVSMELDLSGQYFIMDDLRVIYKAINAGDDAPEPVIAVFDIDQRELDQLAEGKLGTVTLVANAKLDPKYDYSATVEMDLNGELGSEKNSWYRVMEIDKVSIPELDEEAEAAIRGILNDLLESREGTWPGCNWTVDGLSVMQCKNVHISAGATPNVSISIPEDWKMNGTLNVSDHTSNLKNFGVWELFCQDLENISFSSVNVTDSHCKTLSVGDRVTNFTFNSPVAETNYIIPTAAEEVDISYTPITRIDIESGMYQNLRKLTVNHCANLSSIFVDGGLNTKSDMIVISDDDCPKLKSMTVKYASFKGDEFSSIQIPVTLTLTDCMGADLELNATNASKLQNLSVKYENQAKLTLRNLEQLSTVEVSEGVSELVVNKCDKLTSINCLGCSSLTTFTPGKLPAMKTLDLRDTKIKDKVPELFDEMKKKTSYTLSYDTLYQYNTDEQGIVTWEERDHGYYYDGEPEQGYHGPHIDPKLKLSTTTISAGPAGGKETIVVNHEGYLYFGAYNEEDSEKWVTLTTDKNGKLTVDIKPNDTGKERSGSFYVYATNLPHLTTMEGVTRVTVNVKQTAGFNDKLVGTWVKYFDDGQLEGIVTFNADGTWSAKNYFYYSDWSEPTYCLYSEGEGKWKPSTYALGDHIYYYIGVKRISRISTGSKDRYTEYIPEKGKEYTSMDYLMGVKYEGSYMQILDRKISASLVESDHPNGYPSNIWLPFVYQENYTKE